MTEGIKLCKDCKWYRKSWLEHVLMGTSEYDLCASPKTTQNLVTGYEKRFCSMLRAERWKNLDYSCGPEGRFWEEEK